MATTNHLGITLVEQSQSQKEVTVNTAFTRFDAFLNNGAKSRVTNTPPGSPASGDLYIIGPSPTGAWVGQGGKLGYYDQTWQFIVPNEGMTLWVNDEDTPYTYNGSNWIAAESQLVDVRLYGAVPDARKVNDVVTTSGSATFTSTSASFIAADAGKHIKIYDIVNNAYVFQGTISSVTNSTTAVLSGNATASTTSGNSIAYWGTDNATAIQNALNAAAALVASDYTNAYSPAGRGQIRVLFPIDARGDGYLFGTTLTMARNVGIEAQAMLFSNTGNGASDRNWAINGAAGAFIVNALIETGGGNGVLLGTASTNASSVVGNLQVWNVGSNFNGSLSPTSQTGLYLQGYDFTINRFWCKGSGVGLQLNHASDVFCNQAILVGASTAIQLISAEDVRIARATFDTCSFIGLSIDGSRNCRIDADAFARNGTALTWGVIVGENNTTDINRNLNINYAAQCTGGTMLKLSYSEDCYFTLNGTNSSLYSGSGTAIGNCVQYGSGNTGNMYVFVNRDGAIASLSSGTTFGTLVSNTDGALSIDSTLDTFRTSYNTQSGTSYTLTATDCAKTLLLTNASATTLTLPNSLPIGFHCSVIQYGAGQILFSPASGANRRNRQSNTHSAGQWALCTLQVVTNSGGNTAEYVLAGDTTT